LLKTFNPPPLDLSDNDKALAQLRGYVKHAEQQDRPDPEVAEESLYVPARDGYDLLLKVFRRATPSAENERGAISPLIVLFFGGSFILGNPTQMARLARSLVKRFGAVVVAPTYRLAPEYPFPTGMNDGWDAVVWIAENATTRLRTDPDRGFLVGGISAGGSIANVCTHLARDCQLRPPITGNWLSCPPVRLAPKDEDKLPEKYRERFLSRTQEECVNGPVLSPELVRVTRHFNKRDEDSELASPLMWPSGHHGMPRTYSQVCGELYRVTARLWDDYCLRGSIVRYELMRKLCDRHGHSAG
jgi:acetyl esterase/lipase